MHITSVIGSCHSSVTHRQLPKENESYHWQAWRTAWHEFTDMLLTAFVIQCHSVPSYYRLNLRGRNTRQDSRALALQSVQETKQHALIHLHIYPYLLCKQMIFPVFIIRGSL